MLKHEKEQKAYAEILKLITSTITATNAIYIQDVESHPWSILKRLKERLAPSDKARSLELELKYHLLCKGPKNQEVDKWLDDWTQTYTQAIQLRIAEVQGDRPVRDFLLAISQKDPHFAAVYTIKQEEGQAIDMYALIETFRRTQRLQNLYTTSSTKSHSAFAADKDASQSKSRSKSPMPKFKGDKHAPKCICQEQHYYVDCCYLNTTVRPANWKADPQIQSLVDKVLLDQTLKKRIASIMAKGVKEKKAKDTQSQQSKSPC